MYKVWKLGRKHLLKTFVLSKEEEEEEQKEEEEGGGEGEAEEEEWILGSVYYFWEK